MNQEVSIKDITCTMCNDVYTDARDLSCGHTFCLRCLQAEPPEKCPVCEEESLPDENKLKELKVNKEKNYLVGLELAKRSKCQVLLYEC